MLQHVSTSVIFRSINLIIIVQISLYVPYITALKTTFEVETRRSIKGASYTICVDGILFLS